jgi:hypothetical protein
LLLLAAGAVAAVVFRAAYAAVRAVSQRCWHFNCCLLS